MRIDMIDGRLVFIRRLRPVGGSLAVTIPRHMLQNLTILSEVIYAAISEEADGIHIRFYTEETLETVLDAFEEWEEDNSGK